MGSIMPRHLLLHRPGFKGMTLAVTAIVLLVATAMSVSAAVSRTQSKGPIPDAAFRPGLPLDTSIMPDFVPALGRDGQVAGYVAKGWLAGPPPGFSGPVDTPVVPVVGDDLTTLVGHMYPGKGFVPVGADPRSVPDFAASAAPAP